MKESVQTLLRGGVKPNISGDIWSEGDVSILALIAVGISPEWKLETHILAALPFYGDRHTAFHIEAKTNEALRAAGVIDPKLDAFCFVSDNGNQNWASKMDAQFCQ